MLQVVFLGASLTIAAQESTVSLHNSTHTRAVTQEASSQNQDPKALLKEVSQKMQSYDNVYIDFTYELYNKEEQVKEETKGNLHLKGEQYLLQLMGTIQLYDGNKLHVISNEDEEITISDLNEDTNWTPSKLFNFYKEGYVVTQDIEQNISGRVITYVKLVPEDENADVASILVGIDKESKHIYKQIISQKNGTDITIAIGQFKVNLPISGSLFTFNADDYPSFYINTFD